MRHFVYIVVALLVYFIIGKIAEIAFLAVFPYNIDTVPRSMLMDDFMAGLFRRQICVHFVVAAIYVFLLGRKKDQLLWPAVFVGGCFFYEINSPMAIATNIACLYPMIAAGWEQANEEVAYDRRKKTEASKQTSIADELRKLNELRQQGIISDTEFEAQKSKLLNL